MNKNQKTKHQIPKTQKGITLVALVITIIVLLILAVVAIRAIQNNSIINYAKNSVDEYERAHANEQSLLQGYIDKIKESQGDDFIILQKYLLGPNKEGRSFYDENFINMSEMKFVGNSVIEDASTSVIMTNIVQNEEDMYLIIKYKDNAYKVTANMETSKFTNVEEYQKGNLGTAYEYSSGEEGTYALVIYENKGTMDLIQLQGIPSFYEPNVNALLIYRIKGFSMQGNKIYLGDEEFATIEGDKLITKEQGELTKINNVIYYCDHNQCQNLEEQSEYHQCIECGMNGLHSNYDFILGWQEAQDGSSCENCGYVFEGHDWISAEAFPGDHYCNDCSAWGECEDTDGDHLCDFCKYQMGEHRWASMTEGEHYCESCDEVESCIDNDNNNYCDVCEYKIHQWVYDEGNGEHYCDNGCGSSEPCIDDNGDNYCDICDGDII